MAASVSGSKTCTATIAPHLTGAVLTTLLATAVENMTVAQLDQIHDALSRLPGGRNAAATIGSLLT